MIVQRGFERPAAYRGGVVSIGNFDGVHRGHQRILNELTAHARGGNVPAVVLTFDPHPIALLAPHRQPPRLNTLERKAELIAGCGVDCLIVYPTSRALLELSAEQFFGQILSDELQARGAVEGPNFFFGRDRAGDVRKLAELCAASGKTLTVVEPAQHNGQIISSSAIRGAISSGQLAEAVQMLGHPHQIAGEVAAGARRGRDLGFPTANLVGIPTLLPGEGVYAGIADVAGTRYPTAVHVGGNPTFGEPDCKVEAHLIGFEGDLYGATLRIDLLSRIRETRSFASRQALQEQLSRDVAAVLAESP